MMWSGVAAMAADSEGILLGRATELAESIRRKKISAREVLEAHLRQIERVNPKVNAIVTLAAEQARKAAAAADEAQARGEALKPLHGLPVAHKDLERTRGIRTTYGSPIYKDLVPEVNDLVVERAQRMGAITVGKTNTPEFGAGAQTFNAVFGATRNPYDLTKTCGGSSGGAAVALATGMVALADGSDLGGSLRIPAAFCNVVGLRPSPGRVPAPEAAMGWNFLPTAGPMGRTVGDVALLLSAQAGAEARAPLSIEEDPAKFRQPLGRKWRGVKVAWYRDLGGLKVDGEIRRVLEGQRRKLEELGCVVEEAEPDFTGTDLAFKTLRAWGTAQTQGDRARQHRALMKETILEELAAGERLTQAEVARAMETQTKLWRGMQQFLDRYEYFALPVTMVPPFDVNLPYLSEYNGMKFRNYIDWFAPTWYISLVGNPALSVPAGFTAQGLPVGLQLVGRMRQEFGLLQLGQALEEATGYWRKHPGL
ncbi:MAG: amidase [Acidobacteriota bacterium]